MTPKRVFAIVMGGIALARGYGYINPDTVPDGLSTLALVPGGLGTWGWVWVACGIAAMVGAFTKHQNVTMVPFVLVIHGTDNRNWITCLSYFGLAAAVLTVIRLIDPEEVRSHNRGPHD